MSRTTKTPRTGAAAGVLAAALVGAASLGWAIATVFAPPADVVDSSDYTTVEVTSGEVSSTLDLNVLASWPRTLTGVAMAVGTVTTVAVSPGQVVDQGAELYTVGLRPVVIAQGSIPAFRPLAMGSSGADVAELQRFLSALGFYAGDLDGRFGEGTRDAVVAWQRGLGLEVDGVVQPGDILAVPSLPARVVLDEDLIYPGAVMAGGERVISVLPAAPSFTIPVSQPQSTLMPDGTRVEITGPTGVVWHAVVAERVLADDGTVTLTLVGAEDALVCEDSCSTVSPTSETVLPGRVVLVEPVKGLVVPDAALATSASGQLVVFDLDGAQHPVTVVASARGMSVIRGVARGLTVRIPAEQE